jgi:hypothetical protein
MLPKELLKLNVETHGESEDVHVDDLLDYAKALYEKVK